MKSAASLFLTPPLPSQVKKEKELATRRGDKRSEERLLRLLETTPAGPRKQSAKQKAQPAPSPKAPDAKQLMKSSYATAL